MRGFVRAMATGDDRMQQKSLFDVDPLNGEEMEQILRRAYAMPKALVQRAAEFNGSGGP